MIFLLESPRCLEGIRHHGSPDQTFGHIFKTRLATNEAAGKSDYATFPECIRISKILRIRHAG